MNDTPKCIIIAGIHRSGTSYLSRCLADAGVPMWLRDGGDHAECQRLLGINERELERQGLTFRDVSKDPIPNQDFIDELMDYKAEREVGAPVYGFKEPRVASLIDAYLKVWPEALYIVSVRNPMDASFSWHMRGNCKTLEDGMSYLTAQLSNFLKFMDYTLPRPDAVYFNYDFPNFKVINDELNKHLRYRIDIEKSWRP